MGENRRRGRCAGGPLVGRAAERAAIAAALRALGAVRAAS